jgi:ribosomal protein L14
LQVFHLYKGFYRKVTKIGFFVKGFARVVEPPRLEYKGFKVKYNKKGDICRGLMVRTKFKLKKKDNSVLYFKNNHLILLKKKQDVKSKYMYGPVSSDVRRKKFLNLFSKVL